ncbi:MAG: hypothetical protein JW869_08300 [Candidatus Omnitrophica bacterium]|nr:hypothetical protein [Candidatus Omnitrophota bacterium]
MFTFILWLQFILTAALVVCSGYMICIYADKVAQITKLGRTFIGLMLLAVVTSLPELIVSISATRIGALDLVLGDLFGSNLFNLSIVGFILLIFVKQPTKIKLDPSHFISSGFSLLFIALAAIGIVFYYSISPGPSESRIFVDAETALIFVIYIYGAYAIFRNERTKESKSLTPEENSQKLTVWLKFICYSAILVCSAVLLAHLGEKISHIPFKGIALGETFVGSLFVAITTSLPELTVGFSAVKLGFFDMALGNIFGSNMFNMFILSISDLVLGRDVILSSVSILHLFTALFVIISTALVMASLVYRSQKETSGLAWDSVSIIFVYFAANMLIFYLR